jgi:hypothetical protein
MNFFPGPALNCSPPDLLLLDKWDYGHEPPLPVHPMGFVKTAYFSNSQPFPTNLTHLKYQLPISRHGNERLLPEFSLFLA